MFGIQIIHAVTQLISHISEETTHFAKNHIRLFYLSGKFFSSGHVTSVEKLGVMLIRFETNFPFVSCEYYYSCQRYIM